MITIRRGGRAVTAPRGWVAASKSLDSPEPEGADAQPASTAATTRMLAAAIRNLPTPAIGDPCGLTMVDALTLALDPAAVATAST